MNWNESEMAMGIGLFGGIGAGLAFNRRRWALLIPLLSAVLGTSIEGPIGEGFYASFPGFFMGAIAGRVSPFGEPKK